MFAYDFWAKRYWQMIGKKNQNSLPITFSGNKIQNRKRIQHWILFPEKLLGYASWIFRVLQITFTDSRKMAYIFIPF